MSLAPGGTLGPYRIEREIGRGGMGVVHLARDSRLDRSVAVKALPELFEADPERLARFEREARLLASLHHPNVAGIYGLEESHGRRYLILEYVEGETLAERLDRGPLAVDEALDVCRQIALALEAAHEAGIVHRDLKPGNVKLTPAGEVKVLDFGLAKGPAVSGGSSDDLSHSPTLTVAATGMGVILGTAAYMSPEQARGRPVDRRTDIWSFGAVLYECLTGMQAFAGETVSDMVARILQGEPDWKALPGRTPASVRHLLRRCLEKDPRQRLRDIGDARIELEGTLAALRSGSVTISAADSPPRRVAPRLAIAFLAGAVAGGAVAFLIGLLRGSAPPPVLRFPIELPGDLRVAIAGIAQAGDWSVSPDGRMIAARVWPLHESPTRQRGPRIYIRSLADTAWHPVRGSELAQGRPTFSTDGRFLGFASQVSPDSPDLRILRVSTADPASPVAIFDVPADQSGGMPLPGDRALFVHADGRRFAVRASGDRGPVAWRVVRSPGFVGAMDPTPLSNWEPLSPNRVFMGTTFYASDGWHRGLAVLDIGSGTLTPVLSDGQSPRLLRSGHLLFSRGATILAVRFDSRTLKTRGEAVPLLDGVRSRGAWTHAMFEVTSRGDLFYAPGGLLGDRRELGRVDLTGHTTPVGAEPRAWNGAPVVSRDGRWIICPATNARGIDEIWRIDTSDGSSQRLAAVPDADLGIPVISPDGRQFAFTRFGASGTGIYVMPTAGDEDPRPIFLGGNSTDSVPVPLGWLGGGDRLLGAMGGIVRARFLLFQAHPADPAQERPRPVLPEYLGLWGSVSWDGRSVAFASDRSGQPHVYVAAIDPNGQATRPSLVSRSGTNGGWSGDGRRLFLLDSTSVKEVPIAGGAAAGPPRVLYDLNEGGERNAAPAFLPDGRAITILRSRDELELTRIECVQGWLASIRDKLPR